MIYLIIPEQTSFVKVGYWSKDKESLWKRYKTYYGIMLIRLWEGTLQQEQILHANFHPHRYHSELYPNTLIPELTEYLNRFTFLEEYKPVVKPRRNLKTQESIEIQTTKEVTSYMKKQERIEKKFKEEQEKEMKRRYILEKQQIQREAQLRENDANYSSFYPTLQTFDHVISPP